MSGKGAETQSDAARGNPLAARAAGIRRDGEKLRVERKEQPSASQFSTFNFQLFPRSL